MKQLVWGILVVGMVFSGSGIASADIVTYSFDATLIFAYNENTGISLPGVISGIGMGQSVTGTFSFDRQGAFVSSGSYENGTLYTYNWTSSGTLNFNIGGYNYAYVNYNNPNTTQRVELVQNSTPASDSAFIITGSSFDPNNPTGTESTINIGLDGGSTFLSSTTLSDLTLNPSQLITPDNSSLIGLGEAFQNSNNNYNIQAAVNSISLVPEPSGFALLSISIASAGLLLLAWQQRKLTVNTRLS